MRECRRLGAGMCGCNRGWEGTDIQRGVFLCRLRVMSPKNRPKRGTIARFLRFVSRATRGPSHGRLCFIARFWYKILYLLDGVGCSRVKPEQRNNDSGGRAKRNLHLHCCAVTAVLTLCEHFFNTNEESVSSFNDCKRGGWFGATAAATHAATLK